jgi:predicted Zn-dependent protease with MMP-like domain
MSKEEFETIAQQAFDSLPKDFTDRVDNVHIVVEDSPNDDALAKSGATVTSLLGLYQGIPLTRRTTWYGTYPTVPDTISLYQSNIEAVCGTREEIEKRITEVLFHELGHYFGMNEKEIRYAMRRFF